MIRRRTALGFVAAAALAPGAFAQTAADAPPPLPPPLSALSGLRVAVPGVALTTLGEQLRPGPAVITFWATWCSPCLTEGRHLAGVRERIGPERLNIIGINLDRDRDTRRLANFMRRGRMNAYTQLNGDNAAYRAFGNAGEGNQIVLPRLYVFAGDGRPVAAFGRYDGRETLAEIDRAIARAMA